MLKNHLPNLEKSWNKKNIKFSLKTVTEKPVYKAICSLTTEKSTGIDGISQEQLVLGAKVLVTPLTRIINSSISSGEFPSMWKEALVTPKGDPNKNKNYRPASCLSVASKVLEKIVCDQVTHYMEIHGLLSENQHRFCSKRSTMTALSSMQQEWIENSENKLKTGILLWDLSAAYDTLCLCLFCEKL
jgi:hypothetical protein